MLAIWAYIQHQLNYSMCIKLEAPPLYKCLILRRKSYCIVSKRLSATRWTNLYYRNTKACMWAHHSRSVSNIYFVWCVPCYVLSTFSCLSFPSFLQAERASRGTRWAPRKSFAAAPPSSQAQVIAFTEKTLQYLVIFPQECHFWTLFFRLILFRLALNKRKMRWCCIYRVVH